MFKKRWLTITIILALLVISSEIEARKKSQGISCKSAIFSDSTKVKRLYGKGVHDRVLPASTTKVMTALLVLEKLSLEKYVTVHRTASYPQPTKIYVRTGEQYRVKDLLYAILLKSANDASVVLAQSVSGSEREFIKLMNKRAKELGAVNTKFANSHGLPSKASQYTTHMTCI